MDRRKYLRAYVRTDKRGKITPGSLTLLNKLPRTPGFKEVTNPGVNLCYCGTEGCEAPFWVSTTDPSVNPFGGFAFARKEEDCSIYTIGELEDIENNYYASLNRVSGQDSTSINLQALQFSEFDPYPFYYTLDTQGNRIIISGYGRVFKKNASGTTLWSKVFSPTTEGYGYTTFCGVATDADNNIYLSGYGRIVSNTKRFVLIIKLDPNGNILAVKTFQSYDVSDILTDTACFGSPVFDSKGDFFIPVQIIYQAPDKYLRGAIAKFDSDLNYINSYRINFPETPRYSFEYFEVIEIDSADNILGCYGNYGWDDNQPQMFFKLDTNTESLVWCNGLEWNADPTLRFCLGDLSVDKETGDLYATNSATTVPGGGPSEKYTLKVTSSGNIEWVQQINNALGPIYDYWGWTIKGSYVNKGVWTTGNFGNAVGFLFKLPLVPLIDGTYGSWTVSTITSQFTQISDPYPIVQILTEDLEVSYDSVPLGITETSIPYTPVLTTFS